MATRMFSARLDEGLLEWIDAYAVGRGSSRSAVVSAAVEAFRELARGGVPDLAPEDGRVARRSAGQAPQRSVPVLDAVTPTGGTGKASRPMVPAPESERDRLMRERQVRLNAGRS